MIENNCIHSARTELGKVIPLKTPFTLNIYITSYCNFKCNYCFHTLDQQQRIEKYGPSMNMSLETFCKIIDGLDRFPNKLKTIIISGYGEPLINPDIIHMVQYASNKKVAERIEIITNGYLLTQEMSDGLIEAGLNYLRVSIQGISANSYKSISNVDIDFNLFVKQLKYFYKRKESYNCKVYCKTVDAALNPGEEEIFYNIFKECSDIVNIEKVVLFDEDVKYRGIDNIGQNKNKNGTSITNVQICPIPFYTLDVTPDGFISNCHVRGNNIIGHINSLDIYDAWYSKKCQDFWINLLQGNVDHFCSKCHFKEGLLKDGDNIDLYKDIILSKLK